MYRRTILVLLCLLSSQALAWNSVAHQVIAKIAYQNLTPAAKKEANRLIHVLDDYYPKSSNFVKSADWADRLRGQDVMAFNTWHYVNRPIVRGTKVKLPPRQKQNVIMAIRQAAKVLGSSRSNDLEKALFLRFYIHFVGDIHQPLHCANLYSRRFPRGDRGGHAYKIQSKMGDNLHTVWDRGLGVLNRYRGRDRVNQIARRIQLDYPRSKFAAQLKRTAPEAWAGEGYYLAKNVVYQTPIGAPLSTQYIETGREIVSQQLAIAGYRLADGLNLLLRTPNVR